MPRYHIYYMGSLQYQIARCHLFKSFELCETSIPPKTNIYVVRPSKSIQFRDCTLVAITYSPKSPLTSTITNKKFGFCHLPDNFDLFILFSETAFSFMAVLIVFGSQTLCTLLFSFAALCISMRDKADVKRPTQIQLINL